MVKLLDLNMPPDSHPDVNIGCSHKFTGTIEQGDLRKFRKYETKFRQFEYGQTITVVCLDSPGGSFTEAIAISAYLKEKTIGTKLEAGAQCLSACSLIFMAGSYHAHEVGALRWRIMHPTAKLGFHVPALAVNKGNYDQDSVTKAYKLAMKSMSEIIFKLVSKKGYEGGDSMKVSLLGHMVSTPSESMYMIDTVDETGRWDITVGPTRHMENITDEQFYLACLSIRNWENDSSAISVNGYAPGDVSVEVKRKINKGSLTIDTTTIAMDPIDCTFTTDQINPSTKRPIQLENSVGSGFSRHKIYTGTFMPPETLLSTLAPAGRVSNTNTDISQNLCAVMRYDSYLEINTCTQKIGQSSGKKTIIYTWPSGARTVLIQNGQKFSVNGAKPQLPETINGYTCINNTNTRNSFCHKSTTDVN